LTPLLLFLQVLVFFFRPQRRSGHCPRILFSLLAPSELPSFLVQESFFVLFRSFAVMFLSSHPPELGSFFFFHGPGETPLSGPPISCFCFLLFCPFTQWPPGALLSLPNRPSSRGRPLFLLSCRRACFFDFFLRSRRFAGPCLFLVSCRRWLSFTILRGRPL